MSKGGGAPRVMAVFSRAHDAGRRPGRAGGTGGGGRKPRPGRGGDRHHVPEGRRRPVGSAPVATGPTAVTVAVKNTGDVNAPGYNVQMEVARAPPRPGPCSTRTPRAPASPPAGGSAISRWADGTPPADLFLRVPVQPGAAPTDGRGAVWRRLGGGDVHHGRHQRALTTRCSFSATSTPASSPPMAATY